MQPVNRRESVPLDKSLHRILADPVAATIALPPFPASAMDGYAIRQVDWDAGGTTAFEIIGESRAGHPFSAPIGLNQAVRVFTGAIVPPNADLVLLQERVLQNPSVQNAPAHSADGLPIVQFEAHTPPETFVRPIGHDIPESEVVAEALEQIDAFTIGSLASVGVANVNVLAKPSVGVFSSGDELVDPGHELGNGQIYDSNRVTVLQLLSALPCKLVDLGRLPDDPHAVAEKLQAAAHGVDLLITSGGVSVGDADFITSTIRELGELNFWKLNLKPGKPLAFGRIGNCYIFGLPGNPVSTIVTLLLLAKPTILHLCGATPQQPLRLQARLLSEIFHARGRTEFQRGLLTSLGGDLAVTHTGDQSSNRLRTFHGANCLIEIPGSIGDVQAHENVTVIPFKGLL